MILLCGLTVSVLGESEKLKPYMLAGTQNAEMADAQAYVSEKISDKGFEIVGAYAPAGSEELAVICFTHPLLLQNAAEAGELLGFSVVLRVGLHTTENGIQVAYTTPRYWGNAYYRKMFPDVEATYENLDNLLREIFADLDAPVFLEYGSEKGLSAKKLRKYHYMMSMPYFDDVVVLEDKLPFDEAIRRIETRASQSADANIVYALKIPEKEMALFGIALTGSNGEEKFLPVIDFGEPRHSPFLPYEMLVLKDRAVMLHGKYRIALSFPDLTMGTFMKIMSAPGDIADTMRTLVAEDK